jgi:hypothetical protein
MRIGTFETFSLSVKGGVGTRTLLLSAEKAVRKSQEKGRISHEFAEAVRSKLASDLGGIFDARGDTLAVIGRSAGAAIEFSYGSAPPIKGEAPMPYLRNLKVLGQTTYDNSVRTPDVLALATGLPVQLNAGMIDITNDTTVQRTFHGNNVRHLLLEHAGPGGFREVLNLKAGAEFDFEAVRTALLAPENDATLNGWFHGRTPLVDVVDKYLYHLARAESGDVTVARDDEFDYIDLRSEDTIRMQHSALMLERFAGGSQMDPLVDELAVSPRAQLAAEAARWWPPLASLPPASEATMRPARRQLFEPQAPSMPHPRKQHLDKVRETLASMRSDVERVNYMTRSPDGMAVLQQAVAVLEAHAKWATNLRLVFGYPGSPNMPSIQKLKLRPAPPPPPNAAVVRSAGGVSQSTWL